MNELNELIRQAGFNLAPDVIDRLDVYCRELWRLNEQLNLTRHTTFKQFVNRDLLDTWHIANLIPTSESVLDIGSGGGVPGLVLAIIRPDLQVCLSESIQKKSRALEQIAAATQTTVQIESFRAEDVLEDFRFDTAIARAVGPLSKMLTWLQRHWSMLGRLLAIKGPKWREELAEAKQSGRVRGLTVKQVAEYDVPGETWQSVIVQFRSSNR